MDGYDPGFVDFRLERCPTCGELRPVSTTLGEEPAVLIRWSFRKSESCDHFLVDSLEIHSKAGDSY